MDLRHLAAAQSDGDSVSTGVARLRLYGRRVIFIGVAVVVVDGRRMLVDSRAVVMVRMIVVRVVMDVLQRHCGRRPGQSRREQQRGKTTHRGQSTITTPLGLETASGDRG